MAVAFARATATIGAWNLMGYGGIPAERLEKVADSISLIDAELLTLVEVPDEASLEAITTRIAARSGVQYDYTFVEQATANLNIALLYKQGVTVENPRLLAGSDLGDSGKRRALIADVRIGKLTATVIGVHLKSGRGVPEGATRDEQCKVIADEIRRLRGPTDRNPDILLMGDFNMIPGQDTSNFFHLGADDTMDFISSWDLQERFSHILAKGRANLLDGFAISRRFSTEYIKGSLRLFPLHWHLGIGRETFRSEVSDHLPFVTSFRIDRSAD